MRYKNLYKSTICTAIVSGVLLSATVAFSDGDPLELAPSLVAETEKKVENNALLPDEEGFQTEEAVATVTADGDFLLPTYLLPGDTATIERTTTVEQIYEKPKVVREKEIVVPIEVAKVLKEETIAEQTNKKVAVSEEDELEILLQQTAPKKVVKLGEGHEVKEVQKIKPSRKLLIPLAPVPVTQMEDTDFPEKKRAVMVMDYADRMVDSIDADEKLPFLMPHEIRITFYPRASAFSGQSLKWVKAFALAALKDPRLVVELRVSCAEADLQDARVALVKGALKSAGLSTHQIVVNYTNRPVDTMLLRAVPRQELTETVVTQKDQKLPKNMSKVQKW